MKSRTSAQRRLRVADLVDVHTSTWNTATLISVFGFHMALYIAVTYTVPPQTMGVKDRLVFTDMRNEFFTVKAVYHKLIDAKCQQLQ